MATVPRVVRPDRSIIPSHTTRKARIMTKPSLSDLEAAHRERVMDDTFPRDTESSASRQHYIDTGEYLPALPAEWAVLIVDDEVYNADPGSNVGWSEEETAEYVKEFEDGKLSAYGVMIVKRHGDGYVPQIPSAGDILASLWGCDVYIHEYGAQDGTYDSLDAIRNEYLRSVAIDLLSEAQETTDDLPEFSRNQLKAILAHFRSMQDYHYEESGGERPCDGYEEQEQYGISLGYGDAVTVIKDLLDSGVTPKLPVDVEGTAS